MKDVTLVIVHAVLYFRVFHKQLWQTQVHTQQPKKKDPVKSESKLKAFIKRSSEPLLHGSTPQNQQQVKYARQQQCNQI